MAPARAFFLVGLFVIALVGVAAWLLNVPGIAIGVGVVISLLTLFLWLSRNAVAGKRSGVASEKPTPGRDTLQK